jgi:small conductance mechanosensitive channel
MSFLLSTEKITMFEEISSLFQNPLMIQLVMSAVILICAYLINKFVFKRVLNRFAKQTGLEEKYVTPIKNFGSLIMFVVAVVLILWVFEIREAFLGILTATGFAGIVIGLAARDVLSDLLVGTLLYIYRPFEIGDAVIIGDVGGQVKDINIRGVTLKAWSGEVIVIPNSVVRTSIVKNFSVDRRRCDVSVFIDYKSDFVKALKICTEAVEATEEVLTDQAPTIRVDDFQERYIKILMLFWLPNDVYWDGYTKVKRKIAEGFKAEKLKPPRLKVSTQTE